MTATTPTRREKRVTYYLPGTFFAEDTTRPIADGPDLVERACVAAPEHAFCFELLTVLVADPIPDGEGGTLTVLPRTVEKSGRYYLGGEVFDERGVEAAGGHGALLVNMRGNGWARVIRTRLGNWQPFTDEDTLLDEVSR
jgi:hypothetical protein